MSEWLQRKYILLLSNILEGFKEQSQGTFNCRCPICGDSKKNKFKKRGYFLHKNGEYKYYCHNCHATRSVENFLKEFAPNLAQEYKLEMLKEKQNVLDVLNPDKLPDLPSAVDDAADVMSKYSSKPDFLGKKPFKELKKVSQLDPNSPAKIYINGRKIPSNLHYKIYYTDNGYEWAKKWLPEKFTKSFDGNDPRIVLPLISKSGKCYGAVARSILPTAQRYLKMIWGDETGYVYGLDTIDISKTIYVVEGQFDSMFIPNCIAVGSMHFDLIKKHLPTEDVVIVLDNEPRMTGTVGQLKKAIERGYKVCVWPHHIKEKDINDMVVNGMDPVDIKQIIDTNTFQGLKANLAISTWKK